MKNNSFETSWELIDKYHEKEKLKGLTERYETDRIRDIEKFLVYLEENKYRKTIFQAVKKDVEEYFNVLEAVLVYYTYNRKLNSLCEFYDFLKKEGKVLINPVEDIRRKRRIKSRACRFTEDEVNRIIDSTDDTPMGKRDRSMFETLYSTGMRLKELRGLNIKDIDFREKEILIRHGKGGKERIVPVGIKALSAIEEYLKVRYIFVFPERETESLYLNKYGMSIDPMGVRTRFYNWKKKAGVKTKGAIHTLRHSFASHMLSRGASMEMIRRMLGHEHLSTTQEYTGISDEDLRKMYDECHPGSKGV